MIFLTSNFRNVRMNLHPGTVLTAKFSLIGQLNRTLQPFHRNPSKELITYMMIKYLKHVYIYNILDILI